MKSANTRKEARQIAKETGGKVKDMQTNLGNKTILAMENGKVVKRRWAIR